MISSVVNNAVETRAVVGLIHGIHTSIFASFRCKYFAITIKPNFNFCALKSFQPNFLIDVLKYPAGELWIRSTIAQASFFTTSKSTSMSFYISASYGIFYCIPGDIVLYCQGIEIKCACNLVVDNFTDAVSFSFEAALVDKLYEGATRCKNCH